MHSTFPPPWISPGIVGFFALASCALALPGCSPRGGLSGAGTTSSTAQTSRPLVAVIDLDRIALEVEAAEKIRAMLAQREQQLVGELQSAMEESWPGTLSGATTLAEVIRRGSERLEELQGESRRLWLNRVQAAQTALLQQQQRLRETFLNEVRPVARQIAEQEGCELVLPASAVYVAVRQQLDITDSVIQRIRSLNQGGALRESAATAARLPLPGGGSFKLR